LCNLLPPARSLVTILPCGRLTGVDFGFGFSAMNSSPQARCWLIPALVCGWLTLMSGCGTWVTVNSLAKPGANTISYELRNANPAGGSDTIRYKEGANYIRTALSGRGMFEAPPGVKPDVIVSVEFGLGEPQKRSVVVQEPVFRDIPAMIPVSADANGNPIYSSGGFAGVQVTGYRDQRVEIVVYEKYLRMVARDAASEQIWTVDARSEGESRNLRKYLPLLAAASIEYVGKDSHGPVEIRLRDQDADVRFVKKGMPETATASK
jgi:hypothetical protein